MEESIFGYEKSEGTGKNVETSGAEVMAIIDIRSKTPRTNGTRKESSIKKIARHHSGSATGSWESFWPYWNKTKGWGTGGYHEIILRNGDVQLCYDPIEITNGVANHNSTTYHICVVGNGSFTDVQEKVFEERCKIAMKRFGLSVSNVLGHNEFSGASTSCPGINMNMVREKLAMGINAPPKKEVVKVANTDEKNAKPSPSLAKVFNQAVKEGVTDGTYPQRPGTREEMAVMVLRGMEKLRKELI